jgi:membrane-bound serine protease (ClpP class)
LFVLGDIMKKAILPVIILLVLSIVGMAADGIIRVISINGSINPITAEYVIRNIREAGRHHEQFLVIEMDTPGGLDTSMREIVKEIFASPVPVVVYVSPAGARAASAGAVIALSANVCAMASGTNIGAAHPVSIGEKPDKMQKHMWRG